MRLILKCCGYPPLTFVKQIQYESIVHFIAPFKVCSCLLLAPLTWKKCPGLSLLEYSASHY